MQKKVDRIAHQCYIYSIPNICLVVINEGDSDMNETIKDTLNKVVSEVTAEKAVTFIRDYVFSDKISPIPAHSWSLNNRLLIFLQGTCDARTFNQWKEVGRFVKKGTKAIRIFAPCIYKKKGEQKAEEKNSSGTEKEEKGMLKGFKALPVFSVENTEGQELEYVNVLKEFNPDSLPLIDLCKKLDITVKAGLTGKAGGFYSPADDGITMGSNNAQTFLHELAHAIDNRIAEKSKDYAFNEVVAELTSAFLCQLYNAPCNLDNSNAYIKSWSSKQGEKSFFTIASVIERVEKIYNYITTHKTDE